MVILIGPSASGKTVVGKMLEKKYGICKNVTYTTRQKRINEIDKVDYFFLSKEEFLKLKKDDFFFETTEYNNNFYGTSRESLKKDCYMILDINGYNKYKDMNVSAFYLNISKEVRMKRMIQRKDLLEDIEKRINIDKSVFNIDKLDKRVHIIDASLSIEEICDQIYKGKNNE